MNCDGYVTGKECKTGDQDVYRVKANHCYEIPDKVVTIHFMKNGSDNSIVDDVKTCSYNSSTASGCDITAPTVIRNGLDAKGYGWSTSKNSKKNGVTWGNGETKTVSSDDTYFAVSYRPLYGYFHYRNGLNNMNTHPTSAENPKTGFGGKKIRKHCDLWNEQTKCDLETALLIKFPDGAKSGCGDQYKKLIDVKGWNTDPNATKGFGAGEKTTKTIEKHTDYYSIAIPNTCNSNHHPNVFNRTTHRHGAHFDDDSYIKEKAYFVWNGDWYVTENYHKHGPADCDDRLNGKEQYAYMYLVGHGTSCAGACHKSSWIMAFQLAF